MTPPFAAEYTASPVDPTRPASEPMLIVLVRNRGAIGGYSREVFNRVRDYYVKKYGPVAGPKLFHALQSQAAHAGVSARARGIGPGSAPWATLCNVIGARDLLALCLRSWNTPARHYSHHGRDARCLTS